MTIWVNNQINENEPTLNTFAPGKTDFKATSLAATASTSFMIVAQSEAFSLCRLMTLGSRVSREDRRSRT